MVKTKRNLTSEGGPGMEFEIYSDKKLAYEMKPKYFKFDARPLQSTL